MVFILIGLMGICLLYLIFMLFLYVSIDKMFK